MSIAFFFFGHRNSQSTVKSWLRRTDRRIQKARNQTACARQQLWDHLGWPLQRLSRRERLGQRLQRKRQECILQCVNLATAVVIIFDVPRYSDFWVSSKTKNIGFCVGLTTADFQTTSSKTRHRRTLGESSIFLLMLPLSPTPKGN